MAARSNCQSCACASFGWCPQAARETATGTACSPRSRDFMGLGGREDEGPRHAASWSTQLRNASRMASHFARQRTRAWLLGPSSGTPRLASGSLGAGTTPCLPASQPLAQQQSGRTGTCRPVAWIPPSKQMQADAPEGTSVHGAPPGESAPWALSRDTGSLPISARASRPP